MRPLLVGCPVRERAWILPRYLGCLGALLRPAGGLQFHFVVQPSQDATEAIIASWCGIRPNASWGRVTGAPGGWARGAYDYAWLACVRNLLADQALAAGADLLSIDSDILVPPGLAVGLDANHLPVVAAVISNRVGKAVDETDAINARPFEDGQHAAGIRACKAGLHQVEWTGACCLYRHEVLAAGARWAWHREGEDVAMCASARALGVRCYVDGRIRADHYMTASTRDSIPTQTSEQSFQGF